MNSLKQFSNLEKYFFNPLNKILDKKLETYFYYDVSKEDLLTSNNNGVDIVSHQLEMRFEGNKSIFFSYVNIEGWFESSLGVSEDGFRKWGEPFTKKDLNWSQIVGKKMKSFKVYGFKENIITETETISGKTSTKIYQNEPHLLILYFEDDKVLGIANCQLEKDFIPKFPWGDDIWVLFGKRYLDSFIEKLTLENLNV